MSDGRSAAGRRDIIMPIAADRRAMIMEKAVKARLEAAPLPGKFIARPRWERALGPIRLEARRQAKKATWERLKEIAEMPEFDPDNSYVPNPAEFHDEIRRIVAAVETDDD